MENLPGCVLIRPSLANDDETFPPLPCSQLAWWGLSVAVEHLDAGLRLLAEQAKPQRRRIIRQV